MALREPDDAWPATVRERCASVKAVLDHLGAVVASATVDQVLVEALNVTHLEAVWAPLEGGELAGANMRRLVRLARALQDRSLGDFVDYLTQRREELGVRERQAQLDRGNSVQIMTVHAAKGLEFPIVFVPEAHLAWRIDYPPVRWRTEDGISMTLTPRGRR